MRERHDSARLIAGFPLVGSEATVAGTVEGDGGDGDRAVQLMGCRSGVGDHRLVPRSKVEADRKR